MKISSFLEQKKTNADLVGSIDLSFCVHLNNLKIDIIKKDRKTCLNLLKCIKNQKTLEYYSVLLEYYSVLIGILYYPMEYYSVLLESNSIPTWWVYGRY